MSLAGEHQGSSGRWTEWNPSEKNHDPTGDDFSRMGALITNDLTNVYSANPLFLSQPLLNPPMSYPYKQIAA